MKAKHYLACTALGVGTILALALTVLDAGVARAEEPQGVKLRQESAQSSGGFFYAYRSHRGGGLHGGK